MNRFYHFALAKKKEEERKKELEKNFNSFKFFYLARIARLESFTKYLHPSYSFAGVQGVADELFQLCDFNDNNNKHKMKKKKFFKVNKLHSEDCRQFFIPLAFTCLVCPPSR